MKKKYLLFLLPALLGLTACSFFDDTASSSSSDTPTSTPTPTPTPSTPTPTPPPTPSTGGGDQHKHSFGDAEYEWSEDLSLVTASHTCTSCGKTETEKVNTYYVTVKEATCKNEGVVKYTTNAFTNSNFIVQEKIVNTPKTEHRWSDSWTVDLEPTCSTEGSKSHHCLDCDEKKDITAIPTTRHNFGDVTYSWSDNYTTLTASRSCLDCDEVETETVDVTKQTIEEATCTTGGKVQYLSGNFENTAFVSQTKVILTPAKGHNWDPEWTIDIEPTKEHTGEKSHHCLDCDERKDITVIDKLLHNFGEWVVVKAPTCTEEGQEKRICADCGKEEVRSIPKLTHTYGEVTYTWNDDHSLLTASAVCSQCHDKKTETVATTSEIIKNATCTEAGLVKYTSKEFTNPSFSSQFIEVTIEATGHNWDTDWTVDVDPTCTEAGSKSHHCLDCDAKKDVTSIPALGHSFGEWVVTKEPTYTEAGSRKRTCSICGEVEVEEIAKLPNASFSDFKYAITHSKITRANTAVEYKIIDLDVTLHYGSNLTVEYGPVIKAKYDYSYEELNHIGADEMTSTTTGTYYSKGGTIGEVKNGIPNWNTNTESSVSFVNVNFTESIFDGNYVINGDKFVGNIDDTKVSLFFGKAHQITNLMVEVVLDNTDNTHIESIKLTYKDTTTNATVTSTTLYFYDAVTVVIPE